MDDITLNHIAVVLAILSFLGVLAALAYVGYDLYQHQKIMRAYRQSRLHAADEEI